MNINVNINKKNADIILGICPPWDINTPPLGIAYLSRYLRHNNYIPLVLDLNISIFNNAPDTFKNHWDPPNLFQWMDEGYFKSSLLPVLEQDINLWAQNIVSQSIPIIGFSVNRANLRFTIELTKVIRRLDPHRYIIYGGHACGIEGERKLVPEGLIDVYVLGEGEKIIVEIMDVLSSDRGIEDFPSYMINRKNSHSVFLSAKVIEDLNSIPFPDFSDFELNKYQEKALPLLGSRGCLMKCSFCNDWIVWPKYRCRSAENIFEEIVFHNATNDIINFEFVDLALNNNLNELKNLCDLIIENCIKINIVANFTINPLMNPELFMKMKIAGFQVLRFGIESGSNRILKKMNKSFSIEEAETILKYSYSAKIENHINIIVGFPGEIENDLLDTLFFIEKNSKYIQRIANVHPCYLTPGSILEKKYKEYDITLPKENFSQTWYDNQGNDYEKRKQAALRVKYLAKKNNIEFDNKSALIFFDDKVKKDIQLSENGKPKFEK